MVMLHRVDRDKPCRLPQPRVAKFPQGFFDKVLHLVDSSSHQHLSYMGQLSATLNPDPDLSLTQNIVSGMLRRRDVSNI
ncbi:hypothetical protein BDR03DRAFT_77896 [Suillus americanus]|nr:hypothetical protein BDR03DRAFT_77896 [Suillus americanus]